FWNPSAGDNYPGNHNPHARWPRPGPGGSHPAHPRLFAAPPVAPVLVPQLGYPGCQPRGPHPRPAPGLPPVNPSAHGTGGPGMVTDKKMGKNMKKAHKKTHKCHESGPCSPSCSSSADSDRI
uniref:Uncharacterized protein n=1 Tax=Mustela putorius furo TaxID=9669 RepID=M3YIS9_MUSPF